MDSAGSLCPACGNLKVTDDICSECDFTFSSILKCPFLDEEKKCDKKKSACNVEGLDYEGCPTLREGDR